MEGTDVTEAEWLACTDPRPMLAYLRGKASDRKLRLFGCACCRRIWHLLPDQANRDLVAAVENRPDGTFSDPDLHAAIVASSRREHELRDNPAYWSAKYLGRSYYKFSPIDVALILAGRVLLRGGEADEAAADRAAQADLFRDTFGNPFHPLPPRPEAITPLAEQIYAGEWDKMPLLGEWLQEHGYWTEGEHCLDPNIQHVKGCWAVDWVTGRE
jgi:hypothetical protein